MHTGGRWYESCSPSRLGRAVCLILLAGCAAPKQSMFVLIPDLEGEVGRITVTNQAGSQVLDQARQASTVRSADNAPSPPLALEESEISRIFGTALEVQPAGPARFILYFRENSEDLTPEGEALIPEVLWTARIAPPRSSVSSAIRTPRGIVAKLSAFIGARQKSRWPAGFPGHRPEYPRDRVPR